LCKMSNLRIIQNYRDKEFFRNEFFNFINKVFGKLDFKEWYNRGFWADEFIPNSIVIDDKIVANISTSKMDIIVNGSTKKGIQLGAVGTLPEYRKQGLSRHLIENVLEKYSSAADLVFLYANDSVLEFYPRFGFKPVKENLFQCRIKTKSNKTGGRKLNLQSEKDCEIINRLIQTRLPLTKRFGAKKYGFITWWHLINVYPHNIFYYEKEDAILIKTEEKKQLYIWDVIYAQPFDLTTLLVRTDSNEIEYVNYYFPPDQLEFDFDNYVQDADSHLFIIGDLPGAKIKFPTTAQT
jgi:GNAT superfamily N-acetyltransferase